MCRPALHTTAEVAQELHRLTLGDSFLQNPREIPLSAQADLQFKFHIFLDSNEWRSTTLGNNPLQFITKTQEIVVDNGGKFQHPLAKEIWNMVVKCTRLGDGGMITVLVPFNDTGRFDWETPNPTMKNANLWVRVFEVGSARVAEMEEIKASIDFFLNKFFFWEGLGKHLRSNFTELESDRLFWEMALSTIDEELVGNRKKFVEVHKAWMKPTKI